MTCAWVDVFHLAKGNRYRQRQLIYHSGKPNPILFMIVKILGCMDSLPQDFGPRWVLQRHLDRAPAEMVGTRQVTGIPGRPRTPGPEPPPGLFSWDCLSPSQTRGRFLALLAISASQVQAKWISKIRKLFTYWEAFQKNINFQKKDIILRILICAEAWALCLLPQTIPRGDKNKKDILGSAHSCSRVFLDKLQ